MKLVTIKTFNFPHEATIAIHVLEEAGIQSYMMDEVSIQINPLYSNALGGAKLQVWEPDVEKAIQILSEHNFIADSELAEHIENGELNTDDENTYVKPSWLTYKNIGLLLLAVAVLLGIAAMLLSPGTDEKLVANSWCVNHIMVNSNQLQPKTTGNSFYANSFCEERIVFQPNGVLYFPGINTNAASGNWKLDGEQLSITLNEKELSYINGKYTVSFSASQLTLLSSQNSISASKIRDGY